MSFLNDFETLNECFPRGQTWDFGWADAKASSCVIRTDLDLPAPAVTSYRSWLAVTSPQALVKTLLHIVLPDIIWLAFQEDYDDERLELDASLVLARGRIPDAHWDAIKETGEVLKDLLQINSPIDLASIDSHLCSLFDRVKVVNMYCVDVKTYSTPRAAIDSFFELEDEIIGKFHPARLKLRRIANRALDDLEKGIASGLYLGDLLKDEF